MANDDVQILSKKRVYDGYFSIDEYLIKHKTFDGKGWVGPVHREVFNMKPAVQILPYNPERDEVLLSEQFRFAPFVNEDNPHLIQCFGGVIDNGEKPEDAVRREMQEESGCQVSDIEHICTCYPTPGSVNELLHFYIAHFDKAEDNTIHGEESEGEHIRTRIFSFDKALELLKTGKIRHGITIIALQWLALNHTELRERWLKS